MEKTPCIIHLDLDAFFCAVEELDNPSLRGKPFAVGGQPDERGVVSSCSYAARRFGIHSAMPMSRAIRQCPGLIVVSPRHKEYALASRKVMAKLRALTPLIEQVSIDEAFLDITDLPEPSETIARRLQSEIRDEFGLPSSLGIATNKLVAKIATDFGKMNAKGTEPPFALTIIPAGTEAAFLAPLPVEMLWGIGPKTKARLAERNIITIGDLSHAHEFELIRCFGKNGREMIEHARGIYPHPIITWSPAKSFSQEETFIKDISDPQALHKTLVQLSQKVARRLQKHHYCATTIKLKLRWQNFSTISRQATLSHPMDDAEVITAVATGLFDKVWQPGQPVRLLGVGVSGLTSQPRQIGLWDKNALKDQRLNDILNEIQKRFGERALFRVTPNIEDDSFDDD